MMRREYVHTTHVKTNHWAAGMRRVEGALALFVFSLSLSLSLFLLPEVSRGPPREATEAHLLSPLPA